MPPILILFTLCLIYTSVRYLVFAPHNLEHFPIFVLNKGLSMAAAFCFSLAFLAQFREGRGTALKTTPASWFRAGIFGAIVHIPISLVILSPHYFKEFFLSSGDRLNFNGETVFLFGAITAAGIYLLTRPSWSPPHRWWLSLATMLTLFTHTLAMGIARGLNINRSHAYLPPMWLLSLIGIALGIIFLLRTFPRLNTPAVEPKT
jgi:hypothetical protein